MNSKQLTVITILLIFLVSIFSCKENQAKSEREFKNENIVCDPLKLRFERKFSVYWGDTFINRVTVLYKKEKDRITLTTSRGFIRSTSADSIFELCIPTANISEQTFDKKDTLLQNVTLCIKTEVVKGGAHTSSQKCYFAVLKNKP